MLTWEPSSSNPQSELVWKFKGIIQVTIQDPESGEKKIVSSNLEVFDEDGRESTSVGNVDLELGKWVGVDEFAERAEEEKKAQSLALGSSQTTEYNTDKKVKKKKKRQTKQKRNPDNAVSWKT